MTVVVVSDCPPKLKGDLTKWLQEINTGVYVGKINARVREELWQRITTHIEGGRATMVFHTSCEQQMDFWVHNAAWAPIDFDGLKLVKRLSTQSIDCSTHEIAGARVIDHQESGGAEYVVVDIETTGLSSEKDRIIEIAALRIDSGCIVDQFCALVSSHVKLTPEVSDLTGITDDLLAHEGQKISAVLPEFLAFIGHSRLVFHYAKFDISFIQTECTRQNLDIFQPAYFDTFELAHKKLAGLSNYKLQTLAKHFDIPVCRHHRALDDCFLIYKVFEKLNVNQ